MSKERSTPHIFEDSDEFLSTRRQEAIDAGIGAEAVDKLIGETSQLSPDHPDLPDRKKMFAAIECGRLATSESI